MHYTICLCRINGLRKACASVSTRTHQWCLTAMCLRMACASAIMPVCICAGARGPEERAGGRVHDDRRRPQRERALLHVPAAEPRLPRPHPRLHLPARQARSLQRSPRACSCTCRKYSLIPILWISAHVAGLCVTNACSGRACALTECLPAREVRRSSSHFCLSSTRALALSSTLSVSSLFRYAAHVLEVPAKPTASCR